jgi:hypothetical protein
VVVVTLGAGSVVSGCVVAGVEIPGAVVAGAVVRVVKVGWVTRVVERGSVDDKGTVW